MRASPTRLPGLVAIEPAIHGDERGFFAETYRREWHDEAGIPADEESRLADIAVELPFVY